ncbi:hypothetical protein PV11_02550 [Exophiala sideris]|uniref:Uncharacterized protein n=1 Tax=Exophiala sideris TaxID=1016849 RepID=A0A0D1YWS1_9EURO|nr:hypothetical protein PV11_02550 [Exophiala sideris]
MDGQVGRSGNPKPRRPAAPVPGQPGPSRRPLLPREQPQPPFQSSQSIRSNLPTSFSPLSQSSTIGPILSSNTLTDSSNQRTPAPTYSQTQLETGFYHGVPQSAPISPSGPSLFLPAIILSLPFLSQLEDECSFLWYLRPRLHALARALPIRFVVWYPPDLEKFTDLQLQYQRLVKLVESSCQQYFQYIDSLEDECAIAQTHILGLKAAFSGLASQSDPRFYDGQAPNLWAMVRNNDAAGYDAAADRCCIQLAQLGSIPYLTDAPLKIGRIVEAFRRTTQRIGRVWNSNRLAVASFGELRTADDLCTIDQLIIICNAAWLFDYMRIPRREDDIADNVLGRKTMHIFAESPQFTLTEGILNAHSENVEDRDNLLMTPMMTATSFNNKERVKALHEKGHSITAWDRFGRTALAIGHDQGCDAVVHYLKDNDPPSGNMHPSQPNADSVTPVSPANGSVSEEQLFDYISFQSS